MIDLYSIALEELGLPWKARSSPSPSQRDQRPRLDARPPALLNTLDYFFLLTAAASSAGVRAIAVPGSSTGAPTWARKVPLTSPGL